MGQTNKGERGLVQMRSAPALVRALDVEAHEHGAGRGGFVADMAATYFGFYTLPNDKADRDAYVKDVRTVAALPVQRSVYDAMLAHARQNGVSLTDAVTATAAHALGMPDQDFADAGHEMFSIRAGRMHTTKPPARIPVRVVSAVHAVLKDEAEQYDTAMGGYLADIMATFFGMPEYVKVVETRAALPVRRQVYDTFVARADELSVSLIECVTDTLAQALNMSAAVFGAEQPSQQMFSVGAERADAA
ncbi:hypothetical protein ACTD5D_40145 [Nocardia takedensis]|uniref:hypothetical protein n=1 Tax=Nocardia takedensis TaxID=259390 RepID=UPI003F759D8A